MPPSVHIARLLINTAVIKVNHYSNLMVNHIKDYDAEKTDHVESPLAKK